MDTPSLDNVLVVDDIEGTRGILREMLIDIGFQAVTEASSGEAALNKLLRTRVQLVVCDYMMSSMSGIDLLKHARNDAALADLPFLIVSASADVSVIEAARGLGADYIVKPISFPVLHRKVTNLLRRQLTEE